MTGYDIYKSAMLKLGYTDINGTVENEEPYKKLALSTVNEIIGELCGKEPIKNLSDEINADKSIKAVCVYGLASFLSAYNHDCEKNAIMTEIFNAKRSAYLSSNSRIKNVSPIIYGV